MRSDFFLSDILYLGRALSQLETARKNWTLVGGLASLRLMRDAQTIYLKDVLGIDLSLRPAVARSAVAEAVGAQASRAPEILAHERATVLVCAPPLGEAEKSLISKILQSIQLSDVTFYEMDRLSWEEVAVLPARHILSFLEIEGLQAPDVVEQDEKKWWRFYPVPWMLSENEQQNSARKKQVWTLLQKLKAELGA